MSSGSTGYDSKTYESIKYWYDTQAWLPKNAIIVNQKAFDALDKPTQDAVLKAAADAETRGWKLSRGEERLVQEGAGRQGHEDPEARAQAGGRHEAGRLASCWPTG